MGKCIIEFNKEGLARVSTPEGNPSSLYAKALDLLEDQDKAIEIVSVAYTDIYKMLFPDKTSEPTLSEALATFNYIRTRELEVTTTDLISVSDAIFETSVTSIEELETLLTKTFRPEGITDINEQRLRESGFYTDIEILAFINNDFDINGLNRAIDVVSKLSQEEFSTPDLALDNFYEVLSTEKDGLGRHKKVSDSEVDTLIAETTKDYSTEADFYVKIQELDIPSLVQEFNENETFAKSVFERIDNFTPVNVVEIVEGEIVNKAINSTISTINSTIMLGRDSKDFRTLVDTVLMIDVDILESEPQAFRENLIKLEKLAARLNIDIIGVKDLAVDEALELLNETSILANKASQKRATTDDINSFSEIRDQLLNDDRGFEQSLEILDPIYNTLSTLKLYSELSEEKLFVKYGLIRIGDNLYHRVTSEDSVTELYDELYKRYLDDSSVIPKGYITVKDKMNPSFKPTILEGLKSFINTRQTGLDIESMPINERASIFQVLFNHKPLAVENKNAFDAIAGAEASSDYLTKQFVADFYTLYLTEKQADSKLYKDVLSRFVFNNKDITVKNIDNRFLNTLNSLKDTLPAYNQIRSYAALKKNDPINKLANINKPIGILPNVDRIQITNNPHMIPTYQGSVTRVKDYIYTKSKDSFIKVKGDIYQSVGNNVYAKVITEKSTNYYTTSVLNYNMEEVQVIENIHNTPKQSLTKTYQEYTETINFKETTPTLLNVAKVLNANTDIKVKTAFRAIKGSSYLSFAQNGNKIELAMVETPKADRGKGQAKNLLTEFVAALDRTGSESILYADPRDAETTAEELVLLYGTFGYRPSPAYDAEFGLYEMVRSPRIVKFQETIQESLVTPTEIFNSVGRKLEGNISDKIITNKEDIKKRFNQLQKLGKIKETIDLDNLNGFRDEGAVYIINKDINTLIHEHGHIWYSWALQNRPDLIEKGKDLVRDTKYYRNLDKSSIYSEMSEELRLEEALVQAIGDKGALIVDRQKRENFQDWLSELWTGVKNFFGISEYSATELQDMSLETFAGAIAIDLLKGQAFTAAFLKNREAFIGESRLVESSEIQDVKTGEPIVVKVYHGTTNEFYEFDSSIKGNVEGHLGKINYFTSDYQDANQNYLASGMDLTSRVEQKAEQIVAEIEFENFIIKEDALDYEQIAIFYNIPLGFIEGLSIEDVAETIARSTLDGGLEQVLELLVKSNNPVVLGENASWHTVIEIDEDNLEEAAVEVALEHEIPLKEAKEEYDWEIRDKAMDLQGYENTASEALQTALRNNGYEESKASEILEDDFYAEEIDLNAFEQKLRSVELYENYEGELATSQVIADFFKELGFDSIILTNVSERFKGMGLSESTSHIHVFDEFNNQIKIDDDTNITFDEDTSDIRFQESERVDIKIKEVFTTLQNPINVVTLPSEIEIDECR